MTRQFIDRDLITWEVHSSTGPFSLPEDGRLVFLCITDPLRRPRSVGVDADVSELGGAVESLSEEQLRELLTTSRELS